MPSRAKLTTRGISATTVTTETLPKNLPLTNNELDSNFINLRDQTFSIVGDDSSGIDIKAGDTIKFTGVGGASVSVAGDTVTITAGGGGGGLGNLQVNDTTLSPITTNSNIKLEAHGTGEIELISQQIILGDNPVGATVDLTTASAHQFNISINNNVNSSRIEIIPSDGIFLNPNGSEKIKIDNNYWPNTDGTNGQTLITDGAGNLSWSSLSGAQGITFVGDDSTGTRISDGETVKIAGGTGITTAVSGDTLTITGPNLSSYLTNSPITIVGDDSTGTTLNTGETIKIAGGTGITTAVSGDVLTITATGGGGSTGDLTIIGSEISGPSNGDISITPGGTGNVVLKTETLRIGDPDVATEGDVINIFTATDQSLYIATSNLDANSASVKLIEESGNERIELAIPSTSNKAIYLKSALVSLGQGGANSTITTNGAGSLAFNTNNNSLNSGAIQIAAGLNADISIIPHGTGKILLDNNYWPNVDGTNGQVLTTNGSGVLSWTTATAQGITFVGDDSTGTRISDGETVKIAGAGGITTAMSGDTLTISGSQGITIVGDDSTGTRVSDNETFKIAGAGSVSTAVSGDTLTITGTNITYSISAETATGGANLRLTDSAAGTDDVKIASGTGITVSRTDANTITVATSATYLTDIVNDTTPQLGGSLDVNGQIITSTSNGNIELQPNGTGDVYLTADTVRVGDSGANATITTNGAGDLILNTNAGTNSGTITIQDGTAGKITVIPNTTGLVELGYENNTTNFPTAIGNNGVSSGDPRIKGTTRLYSNLTYTPYTAVTSQEVTAVDYTMLKTDGGSFDSANIRNSAANHFMHFDLNGGSATTNTTNVSATGVGSNNNQIFYMNNAGGTKTGLNIAANRNSVNIVAGHGGTLTIPRSIAYLTDLNFARNTGETTTITEAWAFRDQGPQYSGTGTTGTNSVITDYTAFETGVNAPSSTNTPWAFRVRTSSQNWRSRIGAVDLPRRWPIVATHSSGAAYTVDFQTAGHGFHLITLTSNITSFTMSNFPTSTVMVCEFDLVFIQDGTGGRTISFTPTSTEVFKFRNGTNTLADSTAAPEILHAKVFTRYDGTKTIFYWDIDNREYV